MVLGSNCESLAQEMLEAHERKEIIVDNANLQLLTVLCLADLLVHDRLAEAVHLQLRTHSTFLS